MKENKSGLLNEAMNHVNDKYADSSKTAASAAAIKKKGRKTRIIALICAAALLLAAIPTGVFMALRNISGDQPDVPEADPIVFNGGAYTTGAADLPAELKTVSVTAEGTSSKIIPTGGSFLITTAGKTDVKTLTDYITISPAVNTSVEQLSDTQFRVSSASGALASGTVYKITVGDPENPAASYAFQTETVLAVKSVLPADLALNVPVDTGIEITFTDSVVGTDINKYISVSPAVKGSFKLYPDGRTVAFVPDKKLEYNTVYTVEIKSGVTGVSGKTLAEDRTASFRTMTEEYAAQQAGNGYCCFWLNVDAYSDNIFAPGDNASITYQTYGYCDSRYGKISVNSVNCTLYRFSSVSDAANMIAEHQKKLGGTDYSDSPYDVTKLKKAGTYSGEAEFNSTKTLDFGGKLEKGIYLAEISAEGRYNSKSLSSTRYVIIQVSDMRPWTISSDGKLLLWLNSTAGNAIDGAEISATGFKRTAGWDVDAGSFRNVSAKTGTNGVAELALTDATAAVIKAEKDGDGIVVCANLKAEENENYYLKYVYTDREVYFTSDRVNFFGFIRNAYTGEIPEKLYLQTGNSVIKTPVNIEADGSFTGYYSFESASAGGIYLKLVDDSGNVLASKYVRITEEDKPQYTASLEFDKLFYRRNEKGTVTLTASFFDGTPVEGLEFRIGISGNDNSGKTEKVTTDKNGKASISFTTGQITAYSTEKYTVYAYAELVNFETQTLLVQANSYYFHSEYVYDTEYTAGARKLTLNKRIYTSLNSESDFLWSVYPANTVGAPADGKVSYTLYKVVFTPVTKTAYDSYTKRSYEYVTWNRNVTTVKSGTFTFANGEIDLPLYSNDGFRGGYYYDITFYDNTSKNTYQGSVSANKNTTDYSSTYNNISMQLELNSAAYKCGDGITAFLNYGGNAEKAFFVLVADGIEQYSAGTEFKGSFTESMIPGATLYAVSYDAQTRTYSSRSTEIEYNYSDYASLNVSIETDKDVYKPGETAKITVHTDKGSGGKVLISLVDEACFALGDQTVNMASFFLSNGNNVGSTNSYSRYMLAYVVDSYYGSYYNYYGNNSGAHKAVAVNERFSATQNTGTRDSGGAELYSKETAEVADESNGGKDLTAETYIRSYFADNPEFALVTLDKNGDATVTLTVPDNITSWRITACAVSGLGTELKNCKAGSAVSDVICTQPFFINIGSCNTYVVGDTVSISARSYGSQADGKVSYSAALYSSDGKLIEKTSATADSKERAWLKFSSQPAGNYYIVTAGKCGDSSDAIQTDVQIVESAVVADVRRFITPGELSTISPKYYPLVLTFSNPTAAGSLYNSIAARLSAGDGSGRADMLAAKYAAILVSESLYGSESSENLDSLKQLVSSSKTATSLISLLSYSEGDAALTAQILSVCPDILTQYRREELVSYYYSQISSSVQKSPEQLCQYFAGIAALGEPILDRLYALAGYANSYSDEAKLYLALAFACSGDWSAANDIYQAIKTKLGTENSEYGTLYFDAGTLDEKVRLSSIALLLASRIAKTDAEKLARYLVENNSESESPAVALASYLRFFLPTETVEDRTFSYTVGDFTETITLKSGRHYTLTLTKSEFEAFKVNSFDEGLTIRAAYRGGLDEALGENTGNQRISLKKEFNYIGKGMYSVSITVSGTSQRIYESFNLNDTIPSGARFVRMETRGYAYSYGDISTYGYLWNRSGQEIDGYVSVYNRAYAQANSYRVSTCPEYSFSVTVSYVIRGAVEGSFIAEPAFIRIPATGTYVVTDRFVADIREKSEWKFKISK